MYTSSIIFITHEFYPKKGGIAVYTEELAKATVKIGKNVDAWIPDNQKIRLKKWPFKITPLPLKGTHNWLCRLKLMRKMYFNKDYIANSYLCLSEPGPILTAMYSKGYIFKAKKLILILHGSEVKVFTKYIHLRILFKRLLKYTDRIGIVSNYTKKILLKYYPGIEEKIIITPGALKSNFLINKQEMHNFQANKKIIILTVGRIHPRKGQLLILEAIEKLSITLQAKIKYLIVGPIVDNKYYKLLQKKAKTINVSIDFCHTVTDEQLFNIYRKADIFALTSKKYKNSIEGFGMVYLEAGAFGLPVIANDIGGVSEAVKDNKTGFLVDPKNQSTLMEKMKILIENKSLRKKFGNCGRLYAKNLSWEDNAKLLFNF